MFASAWPIAAAAAAVVLSAVVARVVAGGGVQPGRVVGDAHGLHILCPAERLELPASSIEEWAWVPSTPPALLLRSSRELILHLRVSKNEADQVMQALEAAKDGQYRQHLLSAPILPVSTKVFRAMFLAGILAVAGVWVAATFQSAAGTLKASSGVVLTLVFLSALAIGRESRLVVGTDGIVVEAAFVRSYISYAEIRSVHATTYGATLRLRSVERDYVVPISPLLMGLVSVAARLGADGYSDRPAAQARREAVVCSINRALHRYRDLPDPPDLSREPALPTIDANGASPYRTTPSLRAALLETLCSPRAKTGARLGAARVLAPLSATESAQASRASAGFANAALRAAIAKASTGPIARRDLDDAMKAEKWINGLARGA